ncbi:MAG: uracil-DNA glycosylase family protein [Candidatus Micrarchaeaceae archaeon]
MKKETSAGFFIYRSRKGKIELLFLINKEGKLDIPKGHVEKGESIKDAALRELEEETGLHADADRFFKEKYQYINPHTGAKKAVYVFLGKGKGKLRISKEHKGYVWISEKDIKKYELYENWKSLIPYAFDYAKRHNEMEKVNKRYESLPKVEGWTLSKRFVPGEGKLDAKIMIVGQAPGKKEDEKRRPFVGRSGRLLNECMKVAGIKRSSCYICNAVQFFPENNRAPTKEEISLCKPFLEKQIKIVKPKVILALGNVAKKALEGIDGKVIHAPHPSFILRFRKGKGRLIEALKRAKKESKANKINL